MPIDVFNICRFLTRFKAKKSPRALRAMLHNAARHGLDHENRADHPRFDEYLRGKVAYVSMVHPEHRERLRALLAQALRAR